MTALSGLRPAARSGRSSPVVAAMDGDHSERDQLFCTNTVSGCPLRIVLTPVNYQPSRNDRAGPVIPRANGTSQIMLSTQLWVASQSAGPLL